MNTLRGLRNVYNRSYNKRPIITLCITNGILGAISDGLAQAITYRNNHAQQLPERLRQHEEQWPEQPKYDPMRTTRFALYNFTLAPVVGKWYMVLDKYFPMPGIGKPGRDLVAIKRMVTDQVLFAPSSLVVFFTVMGLIESGNWQGVREKFRDAYRPALLANYTVWPLVQLINFKWMPLQYRLPFVSSLGILWNAYLSWINNASKKEEAAVEKQQEQHKLLYQKEKQQV
ncbi:hypothetical protein BDA99DRAFT_526170 [Phascolomyces articulosus]|uniref:Uncharacterized protein n=1 Tax=Phascolomyces articulosus TaxID=60185 RepID=A0AAD5P871_9FUNG|nr:hypothetical protein BDA99DRAFT_526170 [Phascolomyces articulosus]